MAFKRRFPKPLRLPVEEPEDDELPSSSPTINNNNSETVQGETSNRESVVVSEYTTGHDKDAQQIQRSENSATTASYGRETQSGHQANEEQTLQRSEEATTTTGYDTTNVDQETRTPSGRLAKRRRRMKYSLPSVGDRVSIFIPELEEWEDGEIVKFEEKRSRHLIRWDADYEKEWQDLSVVHWKKSSKTVYEKMQEDKAKRKKVNCLEVGARISVWWPAEKKFFDGVVHSIDNKNKKKPHCIRYDDGDKERTNLFFCTFKVLDGRFDNLTAGSKIFIWNVIAVEFVRAKVIKIVDNDEINNSFPHLIQYGFQSDTCTTEWLNLADHEFYRRGGKTDVVKVKQEESCKSPTDAIERRPGWCKPVEQLDLQTGRVLATFDSVRDAARQSGSNRTNISLACQGRQSESNGFGWRFALSGSKKNVQQLEFKTGSVIDTFVSIAEAGATTGIISSGIGKCCNGKQGTAGGYMWRFASSSNTKAPKKRVKIKKEPTVTKRRKKSKTANACKQQGQLTDTLWEFHGIIGHKGPLPVAKGCPYKLMIDWKGAWKPTLEPLDDFYEQHPQLVYQYCKDNGLLDDPGWRVYVPREENNSDDGEASKAMANENKSQDCPPASTFFLQEVVL